MSVAPCAVAADGLDAGGDEAVALAGLDRVGGHADRLQARRAVAVDGHARDVVEPGEDRHDAGDVEPGLACRLAAPHDQILDVAGRHLRHLGHQRLHDLRRHVVGTEVDERALGGTADRAAGGGDDHGFGHAFEGIACWPRTTGVSEFVWRGLDGTFGAAGDSDRIVVIATSMTKGALMQTPAPFGYERATSVDHAIQLLEQLGPDARLVAGGHSFIPMMKLRLAQPEHVIDINPLYAELGSISIDVEPSRDRSDGASQRPARLGGRRRALPVLHDAERVIADPVVRNRGTIGGSLCQADPAEDLSAALSALRAEVVIRGSGGDRTVPVRELHTGPYETVVGDAEILTHIRMPIRNGCGSAYEKVERRAGDWAIAAVAAVVWMDGDTIADAGIGLCAVGAEHFVSTEAEAALIGNNPTKQRSKRPPRRRRRRATR